MNKPLKALLQHIHEQYDGTDAPILQLAISVEEEIHRQRPETVTPKRGDSE